MKYTEVAGLKHEELILKFKEEKEQYTRLKFANAISPIENTGKIKQVRRNIARILTAVNALK
jgi:large subunit ribosomal protein L29